MRHPNHSGPLHRDRARNAWSRVGVTGIGFFLVKGLLWLIAPALVALMR